MPFAEIYNNSNRKQQCYNNLEFTGPSLNQARTWLENIHFSRFRSYKELTKHSACATVRPWVS